MSDEPKITIHIDASEKRQEIPEYEQGKICCGEPAQDGFGLAGGGFGVYNYCDKCGKIVSKSLFQESE